MTREEAQQILGIWLVSSKGADGKCGYIEGWFDEEDAEAFRMAIEALNCSEKPNGSLISRQDALAEFIDDRDVFDIMESIEELPSAEPQWIPVSERLPDIGDTYLVTVMVGKEIRTDVADSFGSYIDGFWDTFNDWIEDEECHVIAWMPLPEPYKGGE